MSALPNITPQTYSFDEYLRIEAQNEHKSEFYDGKIVAMAGSTFDHSLLTRNMQMTIQLRIKSSICNSFTSDVKVYVAEAHRGFYPDVSVVCGEVQPYKKSNSVLVNPSLIVEVLSKSTAEYDRTAKFEYYKLLPSFKCYVLVHQEQKCVEVFTKRGDFWTYEAYYETKPMIVIDTLQIEFSIEEVYEGVTIVPPKPEVDIEDEEEV